MNDNCYKIEEVSEEELEMYFNFLDNLQKEGSINMFGAGPVLREAFDLPNKIIARAIVMKWQETYEGRHPDIEEEDYE